MSITEPCVDERLWNDGYDGRRIYILGPRGVNCGTWVGEAGTTISDVGSICLGTEGRHFFCVLIKDWFTIQQALSQISKSNSLPLPPHRSTQPIPLEAVEIFQGHGADIGVALGDTTRDVVEKTLKVRVAPYPFFKLPLWVFTGLTAN